MLRRSVSASRILTRTVARRNDHYSRNSSSSSGGKTNPVGPAVAATSSIGIGGLMGYAFFDPGFRKSVESNIPGASEVFSAVFGSTDAPKKEVTPTKPKLKITQIPEPEILEPVIEPPKVAPMLTKEITENTPSSPTPSPTLESSNNELKASIPSNESMNQYENIFIEKMASLKEMMKDTSTAATESNEATLSHMNLLQQAMEYPNERDDNTWNKVFNAASLKRETTKKAGEFMEMSNKAIKELIDIVEKGKTELEDKGILSKAGEELKKAVHDLQSLSDKMVQVQKDAKIVDDFRDLVEKGKKAIQQEIASIIPPGGPEKKEDFELFIQHAYKKIISLEQELAKQKTLEQLKFNQLLEDLRVEKNMEAHNTIQSALDSQRIDFEKDVVRAKQGVREEMEAELRTQLKRQAAAHFDHLNDTRDIQEKEISRKYQRELHETLLKESSTQKAKMAEMTGAYEGLVTALEKRGNADKNILYAQNLWLAATNLYQNVLEGGIPLKSGLEELMSYISSDEDKKFITTVLKSVDSSSIESGVPSDEEMRHRFLKVGKMANQTAMIGSEGASPFIYFLSYLQSRFIRTQNLVTSYTEEIDAEQLDTHDIINLARFSLDRGNLEQTVKYMTLLKGQPMNIAKDWIKDARSILEVRQAFEAIIAQASSSGVQFPSK
ncbi:MICOS complex subunit MIC60 [Lepeophtheirus salmonis]|uniref:MICOS complex subunit MIC60 n=1 Tax=Lepeophtheirus salmonis TaxID=72036 RepID=UPI001AE2F911|nr:MICOS complex subunit MIC60-like [Lepeophtheirus salmonis]